MTTARTWSAAWIATVWVAAASAVSAQQEPKKAERAAPPEELVRALRERFGGAEVGRADLKDKDGRPVWRVELIAGERKRRVEVAPDGTLLHADEDIAADALPAPVLDAARSRGGDAAPKKLVRKTRDGETFYTVEYEDDVREIELDIAADGTIRESDETLPLEDLPAAVRKAVEKNAPESKRVKRKTDAEGNSRYEIRGQRGARMVLSPTGELLDLREGGAGPGGGAADPRLRFTGRGFLEREWGQWLDRTARQAGMTDEQKAEAAGMLKQASEAAADYRKAREADIERVAGELAELRKAEQPDPARRAAVEKAAAELEAPLPAIGRQWQAEVLNLLLAAMAAEAERLSPDGPSLRLTEPATGDETAALVRSFNRLPARLEAAFDRERRFSADAAHQLRTPLTAVIGQVEIALRRDRPADEYRRVLELSRRRLGGLRDAAESLLTLARHEPGAGPPTGDAVSVPDLVLGAADRWAAHPRAGDLNVRTAGADGCAVTGDARLLGQAVDNLPDDALRHTPAGTAVRLGAELRDGDVIVAVEDDGPGIALEDRRQLFRPFHRGRSADGVPGAGLGLSVARRLVEAHDGRLELIDRPGPGCRFEIALPRRG